MVKFAALLFIVLVAIVTAPLWFWGLMVAIPETVKVAIVFLFFSTVGIGAYLWRDHKETERKRAEFAAYRAKSEGKNKA